MAATNPDFVPDAALFLSMYGALTHKVNIVPKVCMVVSCPHAATDLSSLIHSIAGQTQGKLGVVIITGTDDPADEQVRRFRQQMEGQGHTLTVANSLDRASGHLSGFDYVCFPDPANILKPDFVSAMVQFLETSPEYGAVRCNGVFVDERDIDFTIAPLIDVTRPHEGDIFSPLLSRQTALTACTWMVRRSVMQWYSVTRFPMDSLSWIWRFALTLAQGNRIGFVDRELLTLVRREDGPMKNILTRYEERTRFEQNYTAACLDAIEELPAPEQKKITWRKIARLVSIKNRITTDRTFRQWSTFAGYQDELSAIFAECGGDPGTLAPDAVRPAGTDFMRAEDITGILTYHYANLLLEVLMERLPADAGRWILSKGFGVFREASSAKRFALYGAGGGAQGILPSLLALGFCPRFIWDRSAQPGRTLLGVPVFPPRFSAIPDHEREDMEIIVSIGHGAAAEEVRQTLIENGFRKLVNISESEGVRIYIQDLITQCAVAHACTSSWNPGRLDYGQ